VPQPVASLRFLNEDNAICWSLHSRGWFIPVVGLPSCQRLSGPQFSNHEDFVIEGSCPSNDASAIINAVPVKTTERQLTSREDTIYESIMSDSHILAGGTAVGNRAARRM
jgi:hypothetical protein